MVFSHFLHPNLGINTPVKTAVHYSQMTSISKPVVDQCTTITNVLTVAGSVPKCRCIGLQYIPFTKCTPYLEQHNSTVLGTAAENMCLLWCLGPSHTAVPNSNTPTVGRVVAFPNFCIWTSLLSTHSSWDWLLSTYSATNQTSECEWVGRGVPGLFCNCALQSVTAPIPSIILFSLVKRHLLLWWALLTPE